VVGGLPWYEGHPDTSPKDYPNKRSFGWIDNVEAREDGLYGHVKWTKAGEELVNEGHYKYFSPVWHATPAKVDGKTVLRPDELISVGFTNTPNMPVLPLSNEEEVIEQQDQDEMTIPNSILKTLGFADDAKPTEEEIVTAWDEAHREVDASPPRRCRQHELANEKTTLETELENAKKSIKNLSDQLSDRESVRHRAQRAHRAHRRQRDRERPHHQSRRREVEGRAEGRFRRQIRRAREREAGALERGSHEGPRQEAGRGRNRRHAARNSARSREREGQRRQTLRVAWQEVKKNARISSRA
jgi:phage I-like protein